MLEVRSTRKSSTNLIVDATVPTLLVWLCNSSTVLSDPRSDHGLIQSIRTRPEVPGTKSFASLRLAAALNCYLYSDYLFCLCSIWSLLASRERTAVHRFGSARGPLLLGTRNVRHCGRQPPATSLPQRVQFAFHFLFTFVPHTLGSSQL